MDLVQQQVVALRQLWSNKRAVRCGGREGCRVGTDARARGGAAVARDVVLGVHSRAGARLAGAPWSPHV